MRVIIVTVWLAWTILLLGFGLPRALGARPAGAVPAAWHAPRAWLPGAICIHAHEGAWTNAGVDWQGRPSPYYGGFQFLLSTWRSVGGIVRPDLASPREQLYRAFLVWARDGGSWREWGSARACGLA